MQLQKQLFWIKNWGIRLYFQKNKGWKFLKKPWCCVGGDNKVHIRSDKGLTLETSVL